MIGAEIPARSRVPYGEKRALRPPGNPGVGGGAGGESEKKGEPMGTKEDMPAGLQPVRSLVVVFSYHHKNTEKIAKAIAGVIGAPVKTPLQVSPEELRGYDLIGFGSGIYSATFGRSVLSLADRLPKVTGKKVFLFSTYGAPDVFAGREFVENNHAEIRKKLQDKGYEIIGEFSCAGWNTNSFLKYFGGLNKGRPGSEDLRNAEAFAVAMKERSCR